MIRTNGYDVELTSGDDLFLRIDLEGRDLPEGSQAVMTVKKSVRDLSPLIEKIVDASGEILTLHLTHEETALAPGSYFWDVRLIIPAGDGCEVYTPMEYAALVILEAVGQV